MNVAWLLPLPVLLPLAGTGLALVVRHPRIQQSIALTVLTATTAISIVLAVAAHHGPVVLDVGSWSAPIGITLVADRLTGVMLVASQVVTLAVLVYSLAQNMIQEGAGTPIAIYVPSFLVLSAGVSNAFLTGDLFNLYVGFEILLAASFVLITMGGTAGRVRAGTVYVVVSMVSSLVFLGGVALTYAMAGTVNMAQLAGRIPELDPGARLLVHIVLLVAFGIKAAVVPLAAWLPDSYPTAPAPVTAVFAGLMTKVGVYALIRLQVLLFPQDPLNDVIAVLGIATMLVGILGAVAQDDIKRLLSFTLVSHIGFMLWGLALLTPQAVGATIYYAAHHIIVQTTLFLIAGMIERRTGTTSLRKLHDLAHSQPRIAVLFLVTGFNLVGVPPLTGFIGKLGLAQASAQAGSPMAWALLAAGLVTSFLTLYVVVKWWLMAYWQTKDAGVPALTAQTKRGVRQARRVQRNLDPMVHHWQAVSSASRTERERGVGPTVRTMSVVVAALVGVQVAMAVTSGPIWEYTEAAGRDQVAQTPYINAVLDLQGRGSGTSDTVEPEEPLPTPTRTPSTGPSRAPGVTWDLPSSGNTPPQDSPWATPKRTTEGQQ